MKKGTSKREKGQEGRELENRCWEYLKPFLEEWHRKVDWSAPQKLIQLLS
jgi:hypothetical protein